ncbi:MAG: hypothetical protein OEY03_17385 [Rhizobacter sp.]|nr:hypothetical protein [Rhizobacter sp.]
MNSTSLNAIGRSSQFELCFPSLFVEGRGLSFPCDDRGLVDIDKLPDRARNNYLCARTLIGREFATPKLRVIAHH